MAKILIVDDNPSNRSLLVEILRDPGTAFVKLRMGARLWSGFGRTPGPGHHGHSDADHGRLRVCAPFAVHDRNRPHSGDLLDCRVSGTRRAGPGSGMWSRVYDYQAVQRRNCPRRPWRRACTKPRPPSPVAENFDRDHLRLVMDKLSKQAAEMAAVNARLDALLEASLRLSSETEPSRCWTSFANQPVISSAPSSAWSGSQATTAMSCTSRDCLRKRIPV